MTPAVIARWAALVFTLGCSSVHNENTAIHARDAGHDATLHDAATGTDTGAFLSHPARDAATMDSAVSDAANSGNDASVPICDRDRVSASSCECPGKTLDALRALNGTTCDGSCGGCMVTGGFCGADCITSCSDGVSRWHGWCTE